MRNWSIVTIAALALVTIGALIFAILAQSAEIIQQIEKRGVV